jgi:hypothetical protein
MPGVRPANTPRLSSVLAVFPGTAAIGRAARVSPDARWQHFFWRSGQCCWARKGLSMVQRRCCSRCQCLVRLAQRLGSNCVWLTGDSVPMVSVVRVGNSQLRPATLTTSSQSDSCIVGWFFRLVVSWLGRVGKLSGCVEASSELRIDNKDLECRGERGVKLPLPLLLLWSSVKLGQEDAPSSVASCRTARPPLSMSRDSVPC